MSLNTTVPTSLVLFTLADPAILFIVGLLLIVNAYNPIQYLEGSEVLKAISMPLVFFLGAYSRLDVEFAIVAPNLEIPITPATTPNLYNYLFRIVNVAEQIGFNASRLVNATTLNSGVNIDSLKSSCGCFRYWGDSAVPGGTYPMTMSASVSFLLYTFTTTNGMCWQVMFTGNVHAGSLTHKYERVYAGRWSAWNDAGAINY